jgi:hypothetical protein
MRSLALYVFAAAGLVVATAGTVRADVCVTIDENRDVLSVGEQTAAVLLITRQFEQEGEKVVPPGCARSFTFSHAQLGSTIVVAVAGSSGRWQAVALGRDDLPAVYGQIVRAIVTGRPMTGLEVTDRTNVTQSQASARRVHSDSSWYARLGFASLFGDDAYGTPAFGFGYRAELDSFAIDVSFLNFQFSPSGYFSGAEASAGSWLKLSVLHFLDRRANRSAYFGGGLSYGRREFGRWEYPISNQAPYEYHTSWEGDGLQGELTVGYEFARATSLRLFVQADVVLPFYSAVSETFSRTGPIATDRRYAPSAIVSVGIGR